MYDHLKAELSAVEDSLIEEPEEEYQEPELTLASTTGEESEQQDSRPTLADEPARALNQTPPSPERTPSLKELSELELEGEAMGDSAGEGAEETQEEAEVVAAIDEVPSSLSNGLLFLDI